jgi:hypothetical protein
MTKNSESLSLLSQMISWLSPTLYSGASIFALEQSARGKKPFGAILFSRISPARRYGLILAASGEISLSLL